MAELLSDTAMWTGVLLGSGLGVLISRVLGHRWPVILVNVAGTVAFFVGLRWAIAIGDEAFFAAAAASGGAVLWDIGARMHDRQRRGSTADSATTAG